MNEFFYTKDIEIVSLSRWLDWSCRNAPGPLIALPMIQRGSVWRPQQVIELWDSLLQGMPIGSMMVSKLRKGVSVRLPGRNYREEVRQNGGLALIDGQQRTLALLIAWSKEVEIDRRIWVDFADKPAPGQFLRLRLTTTNQPFGFMVDAPSRRLSLGDRRVAKLAFEQTRGSDVEVNVANAWPFSYKPNLTFDLRYLIDIWIENRGNLDAWSTEVTEHLKEAMAPVLVDRKEGIWVNKLIWPELNEAIKDRSFEMVQRLAIGLSRVFTVEMPLIQVPERFFETSPNDDTDPPLATLFKRIGTGGTPLSDADYVYSVIKHLRPEAYDLVESLQGKNSTVASLLTATDLVMSTVRLAALGWRPSEGQPVADIESPSKRDFHRLLRRGAFIDERFLPLIEGAELNSPMAKLFDLIQSTLTFRGENDPGLPKQMFPLLKRSLVQVLLLLAKSGYMEPDMRIRSEILRLVLYWIIGVKEAAKASRIAYEVISSLPAICGEIGRSIQDRLIAEGVGVRLPNPLELEAGTTPAALLRESGQVLGESRFRSTSEGLDQTILLQFWRNHWWRPWTHEHPILLWLQRGMVSGQFDTRFDPMAGRDEDTPYDYDHMRWSPIFGQVVKLGSPYEGRTHDGQAQALFGRVQGEGGDGGAAG